MAVCRASYAGLLRSSSTSWPHSPPVNLRLPGAARRQPDSIRWGVVSDRIYSSTTVRGGGGRRVHQRTLLPYHLRAQQQRHSHPCGLVQHELRRLRSCDWLAHSDGAFPVAPVPGGPCQRLPRDLPERRPRQGQVQDRHDLQLQPRHHPVHQHPVTQAHSRRWQRPRARCLCPVPGHHSGGQQPDRLDSTRPHHLWPKR